MSEWFYRAGRSLIPTDEGAEEVLSRIGEGECVQVDVKKPRNLGHHRKFFALVNHVFENQETFPTPQHLLTAIKVQAGWYEDAPITVQGKLVYIPKSIAFHKMDQVEFDKFYKQAIAAICQLLPQFDNESTWEFAA